MGCQRLESIEIPNSVEEIESEAFIDCRNLKSVNIPNNLTTINYQTFYNCKNLKSITIPESVKIIKEYAFRTCKNLDTITCLSSTPPYFYIEDINIFPLPNNITLLVPKGSLEKYKESDWDFYFEGRIKEME